MKEEFHQQWELISFVQVNGRCTAISTAALCVPAAPFETLATGESREVDRELRLEGMDTLVFQPDSDDSRYGSRSKRVEEACSGHYEEILYRVSDWEWLKQYVMTVFHGHKFFLRQIKQVKVGKYKAMSPFIMIKVNQKVREL